MAIELPVSPAKSATATNTIILTSLSTPFFHPQIQNALRHNFEYFGAIHTWAPLRGLGRVIVVFFSEEAAESAKCLDGTVLDYNDSEHTTLRVFRAMPTPLRTLADPTHNHLAPPPLEKNFLISPPGSPPVGWEQIQEEPPNSTPLAHDLLHALERLQLNPGLSPNQDGRAELVRAEEVDGGIGIWVEDYEQNTSITVDVDGEPEGGWYEPPERMVAPRTSRPPMAVDS